MEIDHKKANKASKEVLRVCVIVGVMFLLMARYMVWFGGAI